MKRFFCFLNLLTITFFSNWAFAEDAPDLADLLISKEIKNAEKAVEAKTEAGRLLDSAPRKIKVEGIDTSTFRRPAKKAEEVKEVANKYGEGPFGLVWGASNSSVKDMGVVLEEEEDRLNPRKYRATFLPKPLADFEKTTVFFGRQNKLWRIVSYGIVFEDNPKAENVLREYYKYSRLLERKYGNKKEVFIAKVTKTEKIVKSKDERGKDVEEVVIETIKSEIGNDNFLNEIKDGESSLYSTYTDDKTGVALSIEVDKDNASYITIDYRNLDLIKEQEEDAYNSI